MVVFRHVGFKTSTIPVFHVPLQLPGDSVNHHVFVNFSFFVSCFVAFKEAYIPTWVIPTVPNTFSKKDEVPIDVESRILEVVHRQSRD